ncbi:zinc finger MYM-type protein 1-like [Triticum dicoccoides]|uniref:zinc finger MYM-type protein 1-like n=1 Tax=Triticum dicoccoides TaxID=85692 RepID=UPI00188FD93B|nr:zinc finger MYM-type protein 1-like [Triticum dicoccoides]
MDRFVIVKKRHRKCHLTSGNQSTDPSTLALAIVPYNDSRDSHTETDNMDVEEDNIDVNLNSSPHEDVDDSSRSDIFDPRNWDPLNSKQIDILAQKGPKIDKSVKGPKDRYRKRFTSVFYTRILSNGEYMTNRLKDHERSVDHVSSMTKWYELRSRLEKHQTIDKAAQRQLEKEKDHWRKVLFRIVCIVKFLAKHNLAFRGTNGKLYEDSNGNFLGLVEMLAEFDPVIQEHVRRITNEETHAHYLDHKIQNELLHLLASSIRSEIIKKIKSSKYFSAILDCTPDASHQEQMSLIIRYVDSSSSQVCIEESFLGFLDVNDTTGQGLFDVLEKELKLLDLDINDVRGQGYDNGSNMKETHQGVQRKLLDVNPRAFYSACGCHSLNLTLCDMAKTCGRAKDFFGIIQRIYTIFSNSTKKWHILKENVSGLTLKSVSATRWESRVESVKAIRFQCSDIREALLQVSETDSDPKASSEDLGLANNELGEYEFIMAIVIWYEVLFAVNLVRKNLQTKDMLIDVANEKVKGLISFFEGYRETGFLEALEIAKEIALEMDIGATFRKRREIKRKKQYDENPNDTNSATLSAEESFRINYFTPIVDQAISSLTRRFEQYQGYQKIFGFLFTSETLRSSDKDSLKSSCVNLEAALMKDKQSDIDANDLFVELKFLQNFMPKENIGPVEILNFLKRHDCFPNASIAYRVLLTIPVTVASAERSFSMLKLLKSYMRTTMTQQRLNDLATIALESEVLEKIDYEDIIEDFISKNTKRMKFFK